MDRVGGYLALLAIEADARAYDDLYLVMLAEIEAAKIQKMKSEAAARG